MPKELDGKVRTALNETRLLLLGVQVLLGFQFQSFFQDGFPALSVFSQRLCIVALGLMTVSVGVLIVPSMTHRIIDHGSANTRLLGETSTLTGLALALLAMSLGLSFYVVVATHLGEVIGILSALMMVTLAAFAWFGLEMFYGIPRTSKRFSFHETPLSSKVDQLLTEARVIIPGAQALFGFQFIAMLTTGFDRLPESAKVVHVVALCAVAINVILLMTPAALHRLSFNGEASEAFLRMGSALVIAAPAFLATGIAAELYVVLHKVADGEILPVTGATVSFLILMACWYVVPLVLPRRNETEKSRAS